MPFNCNNLISNSEHLLTNKIRYKEVFSGNCCQTIHTKAILCMICKDLYGTRTDLATGIAAALPHRFLVV